MVCKNLRALFVVIMLSVVTVFAATTGKIRGKVIDSATGEGIPGATIMVEGTQLGASSSADGSFFILQVPPGLQRVKCIIIGYTTLTQDNIIISSDTTTTVDFKMSTKLAGQDEVIVQAKKPIVQKDNTSSQKTFDSQQIEKLVNPTVTGVLEKQAGVTKGSDEGLHVRGGRSSDLAYIIDGIRMTNGLDGTNTFNLNSDAIDELKIVTGGFNAEYGGAMSGIVRIVTKSGQKEFHGRVSARTSDFGVDEYSQYKDNRYSGFISGPIPVSFVRNTSFIFSAEVTDNNGIAPFHPKSVYFTKDEIEQFQADYWEQWNEDPTAGQWDFVLGGNTEFDPFFRGWQPVEFVRQWKYYGSVSFNPINEMKVRAVINKQTIHYANNSDPNEMQRRRFFFNPVTTVGMDDFYTLNITHTLSPAMYYQIGATVQYNSRLTTPDGLHYTQFAGWDTDTVHAANVLEFNKTVGGDRINYVSERWQFIPNEDGSGAWPEGRFVIVGLDPYYRRQRDEAMKFNFDFTYQVNNVNQIKFGAQYNVDDVEYEVFRAERDSYDNVDKYDAQPTNINVYLQDKIEIEDMIVNIGVRFESYNAKVDYFVNPGEAVVLHNALYGTNPMKGVFTGDKQSSEAQSFIMPRIGISYPLSDTGVFHFNYGHFYQYPEYDALYRHINMPVERDYLGNPELKPQKTVAYEVGFEQGLSDEVSVAITGYFKELTDVMSAVKIVDNGLKFFKFDNKDYGRVYGVDFSISKRMSNNVSFDFGYGFSMAKGSASDVDTDIASKVNDDYQPPVKATFLDYDIRHTLNVNGTLAFGRGQGPAMFGVHPFELTSLTLTGNMQSGLPYTRQNAEGNDLSEKNDSRMPWQKTVDLKFEKGILVYKNVKASILLDVENLFNWSNLRIVDPITGQPTSETINKSNYPNTTNGSEYYYRLLQLNYTRYGEFGDPRTIRLGVELSF